MLARALHRFHAWRDVLCLAEVSRASFAALAVLAVVHSTLSLVPPMLTRDIIDRVIPGGRSEDLTGLIALLAAVLFGLLVLRATRSYLGVIIGVHIERVLRSKLCRHVLAARPGSLSEWSDGELATSLVHDIEQIRDQSVLLIQVGMANLVLSLGALLLLARESPRTAALGLVFAVCSVTVTVRAGRIVRERVDDTRRKRSGLQTAVHEVLQGARTIHAHGAYGFAASMVDVRSEEHTRALSRSELTQEAVALALSLPGVVLALVVWYVCSNLVMAHQISVGTLVLCVAYLGMILAPLGAAASMIGPLARGLTAADRCLRIIALPMMPGEGAESPAHRGGLALDGVSLVYGQSAVILEDISLRLPERGMIHIGGVSGGGKTSLVRLLCGLVEPTRGAVTLDGCDLRELSREYLREELVVASQDEHIFAETLRDNILLGRAPRRRLTEVLDLTGLGVLVNHLPEGRDARVGKGGVGLSSGQRNRVALARAMLRGPRVLVLDEVLANLDAASRRDILETLVAASARSLIVVVSHDELRDISFAARLRVEERTVRIVQPTELRQQLAT